MEAELAELKDEVKRLHAKLQKIEGTVQSQPLKQRGINLNLA